MNILQIETKIHEQLNTVQRLLALWLSNHVVFYRCPHCGKFLDRSTGEFCPSCGKKVNELE